MYNNINGMIKGGRNAVVKPWFFLESHRESHQRWGFASGFWGFQFVFGRYEGNKTLLTLARSHLAESHRILNIGGYRQFFDHLQRCQSLPYTRFMVHDVVVQILKDHQYPDVAGGVEFGYQYGLLLAGLTGQESGDSEQTASEVLYLRSLLPAIFRTAECSDIGRSSMVCLREVQFELSMACSCTSAKAASYYLERHLPNLLPQG